MDDKDGFPVFMMIKSFFEQQKNQQVNNQHYPGKYQKTQYRAHLKEIQNTHSFFNLG